jgi:hypothetical protein
MPSGLQEIKEIKLCHKKVLLHFIRLRVTKNIPPDLIYPMVILRTAGKKIPVAQKFMTIIAVKADKYR